MDTEFGGYVGPSVRSGERFVCSILRYPDADPAGAVGWDGNDTFITNTCLKSIGAVCEQLGGMPATKVSLTVAFDLQHLSVVLVCLIKLHALHVLM